MRRHAGLRSAFGLAVASCALVSLLAAPRPAAAAPSAPAGVFNRADFDTTCAPCRDFDQFANGGWKSRATLPPGYPTYGAFIELRDRNQEVLHRILEEAVADKGVKPGTDRAKLADYYSTCMDSAGAEAAGGKPIADQLDLVNRLKSVKDLPVEVGWLHANGVPAMFGLFANQDPKESQSTIAIIGPGGLGLPDRDYYLRGDSASVATRAVYQGSMTNLFRLAGEPAEAAQKHAADVMALETAMAKAQLDVVQRRDPNATYHKMPLDSLQALTPAFAWGGYLARRKADAAVKVANVTQPDYMRALDGLIASTPLDTWQAYLRARILFDAAPSLSTPYVKEWFALQTALSGTKEMLPRWKRCTLETDMMLGDILGQEYVKRAFPPEDKARMTEMVKNLRAALGESIKGAAWMSDTTKTAALGKLDAFEARIGYPARWKDYSSVTIRKGQAYANRSAARSFESARNLAKIGKPLDRNDWGMTPPTVNAYYSPTLNSINFPAGILQPPFFDPKADDATNYGAIGAVIGHEMGHGFDDRGRQFDPQGNLRDWWQPGDVERYKAIVDRVRKQYDQYTVLDTLHVNGRLTLGENVADLAGLQVAYVAMEKAYAGKPRDLVDGFTPEQRFFLGYARLWRNLMTDAAMRTRVQTDPHSPGIWRVKGPLSNLKDFEDAWGCKPEDPMMRPVELQTRVW